MVLQLWNEVIKGHFYIYNNSRLLNREEKSKISRRLQYWEKKFADTSFEKDD